MSNPAPRILLVDDEEDIRSVYAAALARAFPGAQITVAADGRGALQVLAERGADVIISDYKMPGMTGIELLSASRAMAPSVKRILMTAYPDQAIAISAVNDAHIERFLTKPFPFGRLAVAVRDLLAARDARIDGHVAYARSIIALKGAWAAGRMP